MLIYLEAKKKKVKKFDKILLKALNVHGKHP